jgi:hypothetical protein
MSQAYLLDYENPDAGIGHSLGLMNQALKIANRSGLQLAFSETQLKKSLSSDVRWKLAQLKRRLTGRNAYESHNLGNDLNYLFSFGTLLTSRLHVEQLGKQRSVPIIQVPTKNIPIPSNFQNDDEVYSPVVQFIQANLKNTSLFRLSDREYGDYEYAETRNWFLNAYNEARTINPIDLGFQPSITNIAVHIRRGDLLPGRQFSDLSSRMLPDKWYLDILNSILSTQTTKCAIHIFSEGLNGQYLSENGNHVRWAELLDSAKCEVTEHIDTPFVSAFHHLIHADVLIGSKSGMSHLAGTFNTNTKIMPKMWHSYRGVSQLIELDDDLLKEDHDQIHQLILSALAQPSTQQ